MMNGSYSLLNNVTCWMTKKRARGERGIREREGMKRNETEWKEKKKQHSIFQYNQYSFNQLIKMNANHKNNINQIRKEMIKREKKGNATATTSSITILESTLLNRKINNSYRSFSQEEREMEWKWNNKGETKSQQDWEKVEAMLLEMKQEGANRSLQTWNNLLALIEVVKDTELAEKCYKQMEEEGIEANTLTYSLITRTFAKNGDFRVVHWWKRMIEKEVKGNIHYYTILLVFFAKTKDTINFLEALKEMEIEKIEYDPYTTNIIIKYLLDTGHANIAEEILQASLDNQIKPQASEFNVFMNHFAELSNVEEVVFWMEEMEYWWITPNLISYDTLIGCHIKTGRFHDAKPWIEKLERSDIVPDVSLYSQIVSVFAALNDKENVQKWEAKMLQTSAKRDSKYEEKLIKTFIRNNNLKEAKKRLMELGDKFRIKIKVQK
eukprot:TRINITY_DN2124_c0_g2_i1.p1 TRINITY_DN2124_c0_g2~~TRINITY_DN2124_c0_g2_i1.p1  ORF type:complete len:438 (-),score=112.95 TRINITY_DN2124_c0_g2_i1:101-1414(-)